MADNAEKNEFDVKKYIGMLEQAIGDFCMPVEDFKALKESGDGELARAYLLCWLSGASWNELPHAEEKTSAEAVYSWNSSRLREKLRNNDSLYSDIEKAMKRAGDIEENWKEILSELKKNYEERIAELKADRDRRIFEVDRLNAIREQNEKRIRELSDQVAAASSKSLENFSESQNAMLNEMKDIFRNSKKLREQRESASSDEVPVVPPKEKIRFSRRHNRTGADPAVRQQEYAIILEDYLNNPDFSKEAKTLIFDGWNSGDPIATIRNYAQASFDVEFMKKVRAALLKRN